MYPIKLSWKSEIVPITALILSFAFSFYFYAHFPERVPIHWNIQGEADGFSGRAFAAFFFPFLLLGIYLLFLFIPQLDPKKERYAEFAKPFHVFKGSFTVVMSLIYFAASFNGLGYNVPIDLVVPLTIGLLFVAIGNYFGKIKSNWMMGIRTPWTLSSEEIWNKTHRLGGKTFILAGILMMLQGFLPVELRLIVFIITLLIAAILPIAYSFYLFKTESQK